ncbi:hypothetical protein DSECCO2_398970 [anaerobic digester metagenome]
MIKRILTPEEIQSQTEIAEAQSREQALKELNQKLAEHILAEYTPTKNQLILELAEIGRINFLNKYSGELYVALNHGNPAISSMAKKLAGKTVYELNKKINPIDASKVKIDGSVLKVGKIEQPINFLETNMLADRHFTVHLEEPVKPEPDPREVPSSFTYRLENEIRSYTNQFQQKVREGKAVLMSNQKDTVLYQSDFIRQFIPRLADEAYSRLAALAIPEVGNITDCSGIQVNYDAGNDEVTLQGIVIGDLGQAEVSGIPVEHFGQKWFSMNGVQRSEKYYKITGPISMPRRA